MIDRLRLAFLSKAMAAEERDKAQARYELLWQQSRDVIVFFRVSDGKMLEANNAAVAALGYTHDELLSMNLRELRAPGTREIVSEQLRRAPTQALTFETVLRRKDGTLVPFDVKWQYVVLDGEPVIMSVGRDISDRRTAEQERYRFFELSLDLMCVARFDGFFVRLNPAWETTLGYSIEELTQHPFMDFVHPDDQEKSLDAMKDLSGERNIISFENRYRCKDGTYKWFLWSATPALSENLIYATARDITQRKKIEEALALARDQAVTAHRLKSEFIANTTHEIRTPMNAVVGATELLMSTPLNTEQRRYVEILHESGDALLGVINDILDFSKLEAGKMRLELTDFDIVDAVEGTTGLLEHQAAIKHLAIMSFVAPDIPRELRGDPTKLRQVLINLIGNAIKFTSTGTIVVRATPRETSADWVTVLFSVADTGIGIAEAAIGQLFEPFTQADGSTTRTYGGTGLGLSISKQLVAMMGGTLDVESTEGVGSTFWFTAKFERSPGKEEPAYRQITDIRALLIDRDPSSADVIQQYLHAWGVAGAQALSWDNGLEEMQRSAAAEMPYDVVLLDASIDEKSDVERLRALRTNTALNSTPVILLSPLGAGDRAKAAIEAGYFASIVRPVRQSPLYDVLVAAAQKLAAPAPPALRDPFGIAVDPGAPVNVPLILIAEDNAINRSIALRQLDKLGYRARAVQNGQQAVEQVQKTAFALVLMDCQMPVMDGFEATRQIRKFETRTGGHIPIIAMTANAMEGDRDACIAAGMDDYISKPVKAATLKALLERSLSHA